MLGERGEGRKEGEGGQGEEGEGRKERRERDS